MGCNKSKHHSLSDDDDEEEEVSRSDDDDEERPKKKHKTHKKKKEEEEDEEELDDKLEEEEEEEERPKKKKKTKKTVQHKASGPGHVSVDIPSLLRVWLPISIKKPHRDFDDKARFNHTEKVDGANVTVHDPSLFAHLRGFMGIDASWAKIQDVSVSDLTEDPQKARVYRWHEFEIRLLTEAQFKIAKAILSDYVAYKTNPPEKGVKPRVSLLENWAALLSVESPFLRILDRRTFVLAVHAPEMDHAHLTVTNHSLLAGTRPAADKDYLKTATEDDKTKFYVALQYDCRFLVRHELVGYKGFVDIRLVGHEVPGAHAVSLAEEKDKKAKVAICTIQDFLQKQSAMGKLGNLIHNYNNPRPRQYQDGFLFKFHKVFS